MRDRLLFGAYQEEIPNSHELAAQVIDYYHQQLKQSPKALANLEQRGLVHGGVAPLCQDSCRVWSMRKYQKGQP
jgi:hypothetical protein